MRFTTLRNDLSSFAVYASDRPSHAVLETCRWAIALLAAMSLFTLIGCSDGFLSSAASPERVPRISFVVHAEDEDDLRGDRDYRRFLYALEASSTPGRPIIHVDFNKTAEGQHLTIDALVAQVAARKPNLIVATSSSVLEAATRSAHQIPVLFVAHRDPVHMERVASMSAPGVNRTGFTFYVPMLGKALELLQTAYPSVTSIGILLDDLWVADLSLASELASARQSIQIDVKTFVARNSTELRELLSSGSAASIDAWYVPYGELLWLDRTETLTLMSSLKRPVLYTYTSLTREGGLMSYQPHLDEPFRIWARQAHLILEGVDPATIPVERPSRFELALNLRTMEQDARLRPSAEFVRRVDVFVHAD